MPSMDIFNENAFSMTSLTEGVLERPFTPSRLRDMQLFLPRGVSTTTVAIEKKGVTLSLVQTGERGSPPAQRTRDKRDIRDLRVPHLNKEAVVYADQVQGIRAFGSETELEMVQSVVDEEVGNVQTEVDLTEENLMLGAIKGVIADADGSTLFNLFTEFGVSQLAAVNFALTTASTKVRSKCTQVIRSMSKELKVGQMPFEVHAVCGDTFFDNLINHDDVKDAYARFQDGAMLRQDLTYQAFPFAGITFENYRGTDDGSSVTVAANEAHFFARGIPGLFRIFYAPGDRENLVNTIGLPRYVIPNNEDTGNGRYRKFEVQANPLPLCTRPKSLIKGTGS